MTSTEYMEAEAAGRYIGTVDHPIPTSTLQWWRHKGKGPKYFKVGRRVMYARSDLDRFLASCVCEPEAA